jgi:hypothetical protein
MAQLTSATVVGRPFPESFLVSFPVVFWWRSGFPDHRFGMLVLRDSREAVPHPPHTTKGDRW